MLIERAAFKEKLRKSLAFAVGAVGMLVCIAAFAATSIGRSVLMDEVPLRPPGWACDETERSCWPLEGYHFEYNKTLGLVAMHDGAPRWKVWKEDIDTASCWRLLNNRQRLQILDGKATIYDFVAFEESI
jgi:hypothetical protein